LRKKALEWRTELSTVERIYALDWALKGIFDRAALTGALALRGASALALAYFADYPRVEEADFVRDPGLDDGVLETELATGLSAAADASGLTFRLHQFQTTEARVEFTGPLGRRSAAQPLIILRFAALRPRAELWSCELVHPFSDNLSGQMRAVALEELAAERVVLYSQKPRARDVYDLWFILTHASANWDTTRLARLTHEIALEKRVKLRTAMDPMYAPHVERGWDNSLKEIRQHPAFGQAVSEINTRLASIV
jgi:hypothetical protein